MAEAMIGEIRFFPYASFSPENWLECDGRQLTIRDYQGLYATIGATYGGDLQTVFNIPDLRGQVPTQYGQGPGLSYYPIGKKTGEETVPLNSQSQIAAHTHTLHVEFLGLGQAPASFSAAPVAGQSYPSRYWYDLSKRPAVSYYAYNPAAAAAGTQVVPTNPTQMAAGSLSPLGGVGQAHENRQPYLPMRAAICWNGYFVPDPN